MSIANQLKTVLLLGLLTGLLLWVGSIFGSSGLTIALLFSFAMNFAAYWWSDRMVLWMYKAKEADKKEHARLYKLVEEVAKLANIPLPKVYLLPTEHSNAFATGRNPKHAALAFSAGILNLLNDSELKGVIAHEVAHIKNRDILISTVAAMIAGVISYLAMMARWAAIFGGLGGRDNDGPNLGEFLVLAILTPLLATLIQLAISRSREYLADSTGAKILKNGTGLANALGKLETDIVKKPLRATGNVETTAHMFISNPFGKKSGLVTLFSTHPPMHERIERLKGMQF